MEKLLSEMTLSELWELFPIILAEHNECWNDWYIEEERCLKAVLKIDGARINHIGSTAVCGILAKPTVDILLEIPKTFSMENIKKILTDNEYCCMSETNCRKSFNKGYTNKGFAQRVFHLHLRYCGDNDELYFRDYLKENHDVAKAYEALKLALWKKYEHDRDAYTDGKSEFVAKFTHKAKEKYANRYAG